MKRFKNVLVVNDSVTGCDDALAQAVSLARRNGARLTIMSVQPEGPFSARAGGETAKRLHTLARSVAHSGVLDVHTTVAAGTTFTEVIREVVAKGHDVVIISAKAGRAVKDVFFGLTAQLLTQKCPCPVWVMKPGKTLAHTKILVALDARLKPSESALNVKLMEMATSLAARDNAELHVVHAWELNANDTATIWSGTSGDQRREVFDRNVAQHRGALTGFLDACTLPRVETHLHLPQSRPVPAISQVAEENGIDLIVMGASAQVGGTRLLLRNATQSILGFVKCSVLTVKPENFEAAAVLPKIRLRVDQGSNRRNDSQRRIA